jgi:hypothetical protein
MQKVLDWQISNTEVVKKENVGEIMFTINPVKTDGTLAPLSSLKNIDFSLFLNRAGQSRDEKIFDGSLSDMLEHLYAGTTMLEVVKTPLSTGYNLRLKFGAFPFVLTGDDTLTIKLNAGKPSDSFTGGVLTGSTIVLYTNPSPQVNPYGVIPTYTTFTVGTGKTSFDENIGSDVAKIVLATDNDATYSASVQAKVKTSRLLASSGYKEDFTIDELLAKNQELLSVNPDSPINNLVHYVSTNVLGDVDLEVDYVSQADNDTKVLVTRLQVL